MLNDVFATRAAQEVVGLTLDEATAVTEGYGCFVRVLHENGIVTAERRRGRVNVQVEDGRVVRAYAG